MMGKIFLEQDGFLTNGAKNVNECRTDEATPVQFSCFYWSYSLAALHDSLDCDAFIFII